MAPAALLALACLSSLAAAPAMAGTRLICCEDPANGRSVCMDSMPPQCVGRAWRELDERGNVVKRVEGPISADLRAQREAEARRKKEEEAALREQRRKDQALLDTYPGGEKDIDFLQARWERDVQESIKRAETRLADAQKQQKRYQEEAEFYKKKPLPEELRRNLGEADAEIKSQQEILLAKRKELDSVRAKFDDDRRRYRDLTARPLPQGGPGVDRGRPR